jgi:hypothetical protein
MTLTSLGSNLGAAKRQQCDHFIFREPAEIQHTHCDGFAVGG